METRKKIIIIVIILIALGGTAFIVWRLASNFPFWGSPAQKSATQDKTKTPSNIVIVKEETSGEISARVVSGRIIKDDSKLITLRTDSGEEKQFSLSKKTGIYAKEGNKLAVKKLEDLRGGPKVTVEYNERNNEAITIRIDS